MNASNSGMRVVNSKNANKNILNQAKKKSTSEYNIKQASNPHSGFRLFYYIDKDRNIVGFIELKIMKPEHLAKFLKNLYVLVKDKIVYELSIVIFEQFRGKKYASDFLEKIFDQIIYKEDAIIYFISNRGFDYEPTNNHDIENNTADRIFHGKNINEKFDVYIMLNDSKGGYLIGKKISPIMKPKYLELNTSNNGYPPFTNHPPLTNPLNRGYDFLSNIAKKHINGYLNNHSKNRPANSSP